MKRCITYLRTSTVHQFENNTSIGTQGERCDEFAARQGWVVVDRVEEAYTATDLNRPALDLLKQRCNEFDVLLVYDEDRFTRDPLHLGILLYGFQQGGVEVWSVLGGLYDLDGVGFTIHTLKAAFGKEENVKRRERSMRGARAKAEAGRVLGAGPRPPYGYEWVYEERPNGKRTKVAYAVNEPEAEVVRWLFAEILKGRTPSQVAAELNDRGTPTPLANDPRYRTKGLWSHSGVRKLLRHEVYTGEAWALVHKRGPKQEGKRWSAIVEDRTDGVKLPEGVVPALVSREVFDRVQFVLDERQYRPTGFAANSDVWVRGGIGKCGNCGSNLILTKVRGEAYLKCSRAGRDQDKCGRPSPQILARKLEDASWSLLRALLLDPSLLYDRYTSPEQAEAEQQVLADLKARLEGIEKRRTRLLRSLEVLDEADLGDVKERLAELATERDGLRFQLERAERSLAERNMERSGIDRLVSWLKAEQRRVDDLTPEERRAAALELGFVAWLYPTSAPERWGFDVGSRLTMEQFLSGVDWEAVGGPTPEQVREADRLQAEAQERGLGAAVVGSLLRSADGQYFNDFIRDGYLFTQLY